MPRILIIDDEAVIRDLFLRALEAKGFEVVTAGSRKEALEALESRSFDLVFSDIRMPGVDTDLSGDGLLAAFKDLPSKLVLISGEAMSPPIEALRSETGARYLKKPFRIQALYDLVSELLPVPVPVC